ncbi:MAG: glycosyltransferase family 1 protein [Candidatus Shapirobacteria bacterium]|nr:glycosyltransferase family 1 protein [Candidatus Shapirobacteria bacterium]
MIIGLDGRSLEGNLTGVGKYTKNLILGLAKTGFICTVYCTKKPKEIVSKNNIRIKILKSKSKYVFEQVLLPKELSKNPPDIYHATNNLGIPLLYGGISVLTLHDIIPITKNNYFKSSRFPVVSKNLFLINTKIAIHKSTRIITISKTTKQNIIKIFGIKKNKIEVIYPGISVPKKTNPEIINSLNLKKNDFILNNGGIDRRKNLEKLIEAFVFVNKTFPNTKLVITGKNISYQNTLKKMVKKMGIEKNIVFTGFVNRENLWALIKASDFVCYPSEEEGFGLPIIEAIELKKAIILSNIPAFKEIASEFALFVDHNNPLSIAREIIKLKKDKNLKKSLIEKSSFKRGIFSWKKTIEKTIGIYKQINK